MAALSGLEGPGLLRLCSFPIYGMHLTRAPPDSRSMYWYPEEVKILRECRDHDPRGYCNTATDMINIWRRGNDLMNDRAARAVQRKGAAMGAKVWDPEKRQEELDQHAKMAVAAAAVGTPPPPALSQAGAFKGAYKAASKPKGKVLAAHSTGSALGNGSNSNHRNRNNNNYSPAGLVGFGPSSSIGTLGLGMGFDGVLNNDEELLASGSLLGLKDSLPGSLNAPVKRATSDQLGPEMSAISGMSGLITESSGEMDAAAANGAGAVHGGGAGALGGGNKRSRKGMLALNAQGRLGAPRGGGGGDVGRAGAAALGPPDHLAIASALASHLGGGRSGVVIPGGVNAPGSSSGSMFRSVSAPAAASLTRLGEGIATVGAVRAQRQHQHQHQPSLMGNNSRRSARNADPYAGALNSEISMKWGHDGGGIDASAAEQQVRNARALEGNGKDLFAWSRQNSQVN